MPQFEIATFSSQLFWLILCFAIILVFSWRISLPRLTMLLQQRWEQIEGQKKLALTLRLEAESLQQGHDKELEFARQQAKEIVLQTDRQIKLTFDQERTKISQKMEEKIKETEHHFLEKKEALSREMPQMVRLLTLEIATKALNKKKPSSELIQAVHKIFKTNESFDA